MRTKEETAKLYKAVEDAWNASIAIRVGLSQTRRDTSMRKNFQGLYGRPSNRLDDPTPPA